MQITVFFLLNKTGWKTRNSKASLCVPRSYLSREVNGVNLIKGRIRIALVAGLNECIEAANRIVIYLLKK